jgi:hypothetical protein
LTKLTLSMNATASPTEQATLRSARRLRMWTGHAEPGSVSVVDGLVERALRETAAAHNLEVR